MSLQKKNQEIISHLREKINIEPIIEEHLDQWDIREELSRPARYLLLSEGKRIRPLLLTALAESVGIEKKSYLPIVIAAEFLHTGSLLHDDIIDHAKVRRGKAAAHLHYGTTQAILAGNSLMCQALLTVSELNKIELTIGLARAVEEILEGECIQAELLGKVHEDFETILLIAHKKTAALFGWGAQALGSMAKEHAQAMEEFSLQFGLSFQLIDDFLDWSKEETGKDQFQDLSEGKINSVCALLCQKDAQARALIEKGFAHMNDEFRIPSYQKLGKKLQELESFQLACKEIKQKAHDASKKALHALQSLPDNTWRQGIEQAVDSLLERSS